MNNLKNVKETPKTFTITLEISNSDDLKKAKALSVLLGGFNSMKKYMNDDIKCLETLTEIKQEFKFENLIYSILKYIK